MASPLKPLPRRLFELLEVQQEPFNGCPKRGFKSRGALRCWGLKNHGGFRRRRTGGDGILRCLAAKLACLKAIKRALTWERPCFSETRSEANAAGFHRLPPCGAAEGGWKDAEHSPVSVLELHSDESSSDHNQSTEGEKTSTSKCGSPQPRQLHSDFLKEMEEKMSGSTMQDEDIIPWEKQREGDAAVIAHWLDMDLSGTRRRWTQFHEERGEVGAEIGGMIFEEMIFDMLGGFHGCTFENDGGDDEFNYEEHN